MKFKESNKYLLTLSILLLLTIILSLHSLNRLWGLLTSKLFIDYFGRNFFEHLLSGFYIPPIFLFSFYLGTILFSFKITQLKRTTELMILILGSIICIVFEYWFQSINSYNISSPSQFITSLFGIGLFWLYFYFIFIRKKNRMKSP